MGDNKGLPPLLAPLFVEINPSKIHFDIIDNFVKTICQNIYQCIP